MNHSVETWRKYGKHETDFRRAPPLPYRIANDSAEDPEESESKYFFRRTIILSHGSRFTRKNAWLSPMLYKHCRTVSWSNPLLEYFEDRVSIARSLALISR